MVVACKVRSKIRGHLGDGVTGGPAHARMGVVEEGKHHLHHIVEMVFKVLGTSLAGDRDRHESYEMQWQY